MPVQPEDDQIEYARSLATGNDPMADAIQNRINALSSNLGGLDLEANVPQFHTGLPQPQIGGAGTPISTSKGKEYVTEQQGPFYRVYTKKSGQAGSAIGGLGEEAWPSSPVDASRRGATAYGTPQFDPITGKTSPLMPTTENNIPLKAANEYVKGIGLPEVSQPDMPRSSLAKQSAIGRTFNLAVEGSPEYKAAIFDAYSRAMPEVVKQSGAKNYDELLAASYGQMAKETSDQFDALPLRYSFHREGEGNYDNSAQMVRDVHNNGHLFVYQGGDPHDFLHNIDPKTGLNENEKFRAVHDAFGHAILGNTFGPQGEERAWGVHSQMYSPLARMAMTSETRGQNSVVNYTPLNMKTFDQLGQIEMRMADAIKAGRLDEVKQLQEAKKEAMGNWQFAPQKAVLLPPEFLSTDYAGGMPDYIRPLIKPETGTTFYSSLTHFSNDPNLTVTNPSLYGTGLKGAERDRIFRLPGGVTDRSYFYLGTPGRVSPEPGLGPRKYAASSENLYDWNKDPAGLWAIAQELNRAPATATTDPAWINMSQAFNDVERLAKEYGYSGIANTNHRYPMAVMFDPTPVQKVGRNSGGRTMGNNAMDNALRMARGHFDDGGDTGGGGDNERADSVSQSEQASADRAYAQDQQSSFNARGGDLPSMSYALAQQPAGSVDMTANQARLGDMPDMSSALAAMSRPQQNEMMSDYSNALSLGQALSPVQQRALALANQFAIPESGGQQSAYNPVTGAFGQYQLLPSTALSLQEKYAPLTEYGAYTAQPNPITGVPSNPMQNLMTPDERLSNIALNPDLQSQLAMNLTLENTQALQRAGLDTSQGNVYAAHFLGAPTAEKVLSSDPSTAIAQLVDPKVIAANPQLQGMTVGQFKQYAADQSARAGSPAAGPISAGYATYAGGDINTPGAVVSDVTPSVATTAAPKQSILDRIFGSTADQISNLEAQGRYTGMDKQQYADQFASPTPGVEGSGDLSKVQTRIVDYGQGPQVDYYTKSLGQALFGDLFGGGQSAPSQQDQAIQSALYTARGGGNGNQQTVSAAPVSTAQQPNYLSQLTQSNLALPNTEGLTAQQWADKYAGGDLSKINARIKYVNGAPMLEYYL